MTPADALITWVSAMRTTSAARWSHRSELAMTRTASASFVTGFMRCSGEVPGT